jgi:hypothetical protein
VLCAGIGSSWRQPFGSIPFTRPATDSKDESDRFLRLERRPPSPAAIAKPSMKTPDRSTLLTLALFAGAPLFLAAGLAAARSGATIGLDRWTYIHADDDRSPASTTKKRGSFGIDFADVTGDGRLDIVSGSHFYRNPGSDMARTPWPEVTLPRAASGEPLDAGLLFNVSGRGPARDILAQSLPDIVWLHTADQGKTWKPKVVAQMPPPRHGNGRMMKIAKITPGFNRPEILLTAGGGTYLMQVPADPSAGNWPIRKITHTDHDEQKAIGLGDIDGDGHLDLVLSGGLRRPEIEWWRNPGSAPGSGIWEKHFVGNTINMSKMIEVADVNGNGRLDVVATDSENPDSGLFWFEAPRDPIRGKWIRHDIDKGYNGLDSLSVADMNRDGRPDIVVGETKDQLRLVIYENVGGGKSWKKHLVDQGKESHKGANAVDLDGDGDLDIVSISYFGFQDLHIWRNDNGR